MNTQPDTRTVATATITWFEDDSSGRGYLFVDFDDGGSAEIQWPGEPISVHADTDAIADWAAAELGLDVLHTEHDREYIHAQMRQR